MRGVDSQAWSRPVAAYFGQVLALVLLVIVGCAQQAPPDAARYLQGAEIQAETDEQRAAIAAALADMSSLTPQELRKKRYGPDNKDLPGILRSHVVPKAPVPVTDDAFYDQVGDSRVRESAKALLARMSKGGR